MPNVAIVGAGQIGKVICKFLTESGDYHVSVLDRTQTHLDQIPDRLDIEKRCVDVSKSDVLTRNLRSQDAVINAAPDHLTLTIARACVNLDVPYLDLTADVASTRRVIHLAEKHSSLVIPQCGLAPGFVSVLAGDLARKFDHIDALTIRVGALPRVPSNPFKYNLTWSTEGLVNEYCEPCTEIVNGELTTVQPFERHEQFQVSGVVYESFSTSGGIGTLAQSLVDSVNNLNYQTIRYPGHRAIMKFLLQDLKLAEHREHFIEFLEHVIPSTDQDIVLVHVSCNGTKDGIVTQETFTKEIHAQTINGEHLRAIQIATASGICTILDLLFEGKLPSRGIVRQEQIDLAKFLDNRFGQYFRPLLQS